MNLKSQYGLDRRGTVPVTDYWFCSDKCYEDAIDPYIEDSNYSLKYNRENLSPKLRREILALGQECEDTYINAPGEPGTDCDMDFVRRLKNHFEEQKQELFNQWELKRFSLLTAAQVGFHSRIRQESMWEDNKKAEEYLKKLDKEAKDEEKQWGRDAEETRRIHERQRKEREKQEKIDEQKRKEQEKLEEQKRLEEERLEALKEKPIPLDYRFDHTHILGSSGQGKSSLIIDQFLKDIKDPRNPAIVILDPKGTMVNQLRRIDEIGFTSPPTRDRNDRLVIIDPTLFTPALNMFAPPKREYPPEIAQQLENNALSLFQYVFSSKGSALTDKQLTCFSFAVRLVLTIPDATIRTFLNLMNDKPISKIGGMRPDSPFKPFIDKLGETPRRFFYDSFYDITEYAATKDQIATRVYGMLHYTVFDKMFSTPKNNIDMFDHLQKGRIVLISSPKSILGAEGSQLFSRYMVALTLQAAFERITIPKYQWHPALLVIDEAQDVIDEDKTQDLLQQAREFKLGVTIAHQQIKGKSPRQFSLLFQPTRESNMPLPAHRRTLPRWPAI